MQHMDSVIKQKLPIFRPFLLLLNAFYVFVPSCHILVLVCTCMYALMVCRQAPIAHLMQEMILL